ncbi:MAG: transporter substrate-binding domain-containing protein [Magnetovibrio sp.]|nr:transporter substrate-binding domain-containing protein [Magnetovibrio sp.]
MPYRIALVLLSLMFVISIPAQALEDAPSEKIVIGFPNVLPYHAEDDDGNVRGFYIDILDAVMGELGVSNYTYMGMPWGRALKMLEGGKIHMLLAPLKTPQREQYAYFSDAPLWPTYWGFFIRKDRQEDMAYRSYKDLNGKAVGLMRAYWLPPKIKAYAEKNADVRYGHSEESNFKMLARDRLDLISSEYSIGRYYLQSLGIEDDVLFLKDNLFMAGNHYVAFSKKAVKASFAKRFSAHLAAFKKTTQFQELMKRHNMKILDVQKGDWKIVN